MAKKRKVNYARLLLLVLVAILLVAIIVMGVKLILKDDSDTNSKDDTTPSVITNSDTKIELGDYTVYEDKNADLGFNFVVATLNFSNDNGINYDLSNLKTNEGIVLNSVSEYQQQLTMSNYSYSLLGTVNDVVSSEKTYSAKVFIPYKSTTSSLILTDAISNSSLYIDVNNNKGDIDTLKRQDNSNELISNDYNISVKNNYISSNMYHNGERYDSPYNSYVFEMTVNSITSGVKIVGATFRQTSTGEEYPAMDASYTTSISGKDMDNILDKELKAGDTYALLFDVMAGEDEKPDYKGTITIEFSDNSTVTIDTELN